MNKHMVIKEEARIMFKISRNEKIIGQEKNRLLNLMRQYEREIDRLPSGRIQTIELCGQKLLYLVSDEYGKKNGKSIGHLNSRQLEELSEQLNKRVVLERKLQKINEELKKIRIAIQYNKVDEYVKEFESNNPLIN